MKNIPFILMKTVKSNHIMIKNVNYILNFYVV